MRTLRLGSVPYLNAAPLVDGLDDHRDARLTCDVPARLVAALRAGRLDAALASAVELFRAPRLTWVAGPMVGSAGPVRSILLFLRCDPRQVRTLALDDASLSGAALAQVCLAEFLGAREPALCRCSARDALSEVDADAVLRIGDAALTTDPGGRAVLDLGAVWTAETGLPFVYAVWLARPEVDARALVDIVTAAAAHGVPRRAEIAAAFARAHQLDPGACQSYLHDCIRYELRRAERLGLELFGRLAHAHGLVDHAELAEPLAG